MFARLVGVAMVLLAAGAGCGRADRARPELPGSRALDGVWSGDFVLDSPLLPGHMPAQRIVHGELALVQNAVLEQTAGISGPPTHSGSYAVEFRPFGFEVAGGHQVPSLVARLADRDSVEMALQPDRPGKVWMQGVLTGDSIVGRWYFDVERAGTASGHFLLRRR